MLECGKGLLAFLRAYYHHNSADRPGRKLFPLSGLTADETRPVRRGRGLLSPRLPQVRRARHEPTPRPPKHSKRDEPASNPVRYHGKAEAQPCTSQFPRPHEAVE